MGHTWHARAVAVPVALLLVCSAGCVKAIVLRPAHTFTAAYSNAATVRKMLSLPEEGAAEPAKVGTPLYVMPPRDEKSRTRDPSKAYRKLAPELDIRSSLAHVVTEWRELTDADLAHVTKSSRTFGMPPQEEHEEMSPGDRAYAAVVRAYADPSSTLEAIAPEFDEDSATGFADASNTDPGEGSEHSGTTWGAPAMAMWPTGEEACWSRGEHYSQLREADAIVEGHPEWRQNPIEIAHLDTGYAGDDPLLPETLQVDESKSFVPETTADAGEGHGNATLSTLSAGVVRVQDGAGATAYDDVLGSNPYAHVREYRISSAQPVFEGGFSWGPVHLDPRRMSLAIAQAADAGVDVVSLSAGGMPSLLQAWAVNHAYENGTAIVAATGDFFTLPFLPYSTPRQVVYPANYGRVLGVAGVTAEDRSYGKAPCYFCLWRLWQWDQWMLRGSYGPTASMRGHVVSGYAPNVCHSSGRGSVDRDGGGTSHATPQVAGAAALWLAAHRSEIPAAEWRSWKKSEAVYQALMTSADKGVAEYDVETMGEGVVRAKALLETQVDLDALQEREKSEIDPFWLVRELLSTGVLQSPGVQLRQGLLDMVETELRQIMYHSNGVRDSLEELDLHNSGDCKRLASAILASGKASRTLTGWLRAYLAKS